MVTLDKFSISLNPNFFLICKMGSILPRPPLKDVPSSRCPAHSGPLINVAVITQHQSSFKINACCRWCLESAGASWHLIGGHWLEEGRVSCYSWRSWNSAKFQVPWGSPGWSRSADHVSSEVWTQDILLDPSTWSRLEGTLGHRVC